MSATHPYITMAPVINLDVIASAISLARDTLTDLTITARNDEYFGGRSFQLRIDEGHSLRGLKALHKLVRLKAPIVFLTASWGPLASRPLASCLPRSLESLTITADLSEQASFAWADHWEDNFEVGLGVIEPRDDHPVHELLRRFLATWEEATPHLEEICVQDWECLHDDSDDSPCLSRLGESMGLAIRFPAHVVCTDCYECRQ